MMMIRAVSSLMLIAGAYGQGEAPRGSMVLTGANSGVAEERLGRAIDQESWVNAWRILFRPSMHAKLHRPQVDFSTKMVVYCFMGKAENVSGLVLREWKGTNSELILNIEKLDYQRLSDGRGDLTTPYAFFIVPRTSKPVLINFDQRSLADRAATRAPRWRQWLRRDFCE
jgi:hypothetical protein